MARLLILLLFIAAGFGVHQVFLDYKVRQKAERNPWPEHFSNLLSHHVSKTLLTGAPPKGDKTFLQLLYAAHRVEQDGYPLLDNIRHGASLAGADATEAPLLAAAILDNLNRARTFGVYDDPSNLLKLERGEPPVAHSEGWEGELLVMGFKISPLLAPELCATLPNMVLMPEHLRNMQSDTTPPEAPTLTSRWLSARLISPESAIAIRDKIKQDSSQR